MEERRHDSRVQTHEHIAEVRKLLGVCIRDLTLRQEDHDQSKLIEPELAYFDEFTPKLAKSTYGSEEYENYRKAMQPALDHHYAKNNHHPEHYPEIDDEETQTLKRDIEVLEACTDLPTTIRNRLVARLQMDLRDEKSPINHMSLLDVLEMFCDWCAATKRHNDGNILKSIAHNQKRFGYPDMIANIFRKTADDLL